MTDMTREEIFRMGVVTQQLGIRDEEELIEMARFFYVYKARADLASEEVRRLRIAVGGHRPLTRWQVSGLRQRLATLAYILEIK